MPRPFQSPRERIATIVKGYPRLSETFIAQEIKGLEDRGVDQLIVSLRHPTDKVTHPVHDEIMAGTLYLPEYLKDEPQRVRKAKLWAKKHAEYDRLMSVFERDLKRDKTVNRWRRLGQAMVLAHELPDDIVGFYVHYLHTPSSVARYASILTGLPFAFSAHAKDIWTSPDWELSEKIEEAKWGVTCTKLNAEYLNKLSGQKGKVRLVHHGLDVTALGRPPTKREPLPPLRLISVGRAVEKKGYADLIAALKQLPETLEWRFDHVGGGAGLKDLKQRAVKADLSERVTWHGSQARTKVIDLLREAHIFILPSRIAKSGDRDGLPNVLMEAMSMELPCIATNISAIPEIIVEGDTGLMVDQRSPKALSEAILKLANDPHERERMGVAGRERVLKHFSPNPGLDLIATLLGDLR